jgi:NAD(P)-dependent dehydrogenase (short-subunit alcohol dehydrogenase family)
MRDRYRNNPAAPLEGRGEDPRWPPGDGREVAAVVVMVAVTAYITGQALRVTGGLHFN